MRQIGKPEPEILQVTLLLVMVFGCGLFIACFGSSSSEPDYVLKDFYGRVASGDNAAALELVCSDDREEFFSGLASVGTDYAPTTLSPSETAARLTTEVKTLSGDDATVRVRGNIKTPRGEATINEFVTMLRKGASWCLSNPEQDNLSADRRDLPGPLSDLGSLSVTGPPQEITGAPVVTESGLEYFDMEVGQGHGPREGSTVTIFYTIWLATADEPFDSTSDRNEVFKYPVGEGMVISGLEEGVATMKEGGIRRLVLPPELAYGSEGRPPTVPPNATLIFDVKLVQVSGLRD